MEFAETLNIFNARNAIRKGLLPLVSCRDSHQHLVNRFDFLKKFIATLPDCAALSAIVPLLFFLSFAILPGCDNEATQKPKKRTQEHLVEVALANRTSVGVSHTRTGTLSALREVKIINQEEGQIIALPHYEGDRIKKGDTVAKLDDKLLRAQLTRAQATRKKAEQDLKRITNLNKKNLVSAEELTRAQTELQVSQADEKVLITRVGFTTITSPINGVVTQRPTEVGNLAERYTHLLTISDPASLVTEVNVSELILTHLSINDATRVTIDALGDKEFKGNISRIYPNLDPITRQGTIEVTLNPVPKGARPGQLCRVQLNTQISERLIIPFHALRRDTSGEYVYVVNADNRVERIKVISGQRFDEFVEIIQGIKAADQVVTKGFLGLTPDKAVKIVTHTEQKAEQKAEHKATPEADNY